MADKTAVKAKIINIAEKNGEIHVKVTTEALAGTFNATGFAAKLTLVKSRPGEAYAQIDVKATAEAKAFFTKGKTISLT